MVEVNPAKFKRNEEYYEKNIFDPLYGIDAITGSPGYNAPGFIDYLQKGYEINEAGLYYYPDHVEFETQKDYVNARYGENMLFSIVDYAELHELSDAPFREMDILPLPKITGEEPYISGTVLALSSNTQNEDLAEHFLTTFLSEEYQYENAFEMQIYADIAQYDIMKTYSPQIAAWIAYTTAHSTPITLPLSAWKWLDSVTLPQDNADLTPWLVRIQQEAEEIFQ